MAARKTHALLLASLAALGCAGRFGRAGPGPPPRVLAPEVVRWRTGGRRTLEFALDNPTDRGFDVPPPAHRAWVDVQPTGGGRSCHLRPDAPDLPSVHVNARSRVAVTVDLGVACRDLPPGDYRYDLRVDLPPILDGPPARGDPLASASGALVVEAQAVPIPRAPQVVAPPGGTLPPAPAVPRAPDPQAPPGTTGPPSSATAECVDRELRRLGRNAYGDPPGTVDPGAPPIPDAERISRVLARFPEIRTTCAVPQLR